MTCVKKVIVDHPLKEVGEVSEKSLPTMMTPYRIIDWYPERTFWSDWEEVDRRDADYEVTHALDIQRTLFTAVVTKSMTRRPIHTTERRRQFRTWTDEATGKQMAEVINTEFRSSTF